MDNRYRRRYSDSDRPRRQRKISEEKEKVLNNIFQWVVVVLSGAILGYALITFVFQTVTVVGPSMNPTLEDGEVVIVNKLVYNIGEVERYDIIAYSLIEEDGYYDIKRVIGMPGEKITIKDGYVYIDDKQLSTGPFGDKIITAGLASNTITLGDGEYFVMGDNVNNSEDSRYTNIGNISEAEILGKVTRIVKSDDKKGRVE
ncbi:MAG: signal peptidase I [Lachnospiraceae bacterium]|nr:signal peptidase I [Lachnospiraceae bacterium]